MPTDPDVQRLLAVIFAAVSMVERDQRRLIECIERRGMSVMVREVQQWLRKIEQLIEFIQRKGGSVTAREVQRGMRKIKSAEQANDALGCLVEAKLGTWEQTPPGRQGQPTRRFVLAASVDVDRCRQNSEGKGNPVQLVDPAYCLNDFGLEN